MKIRPSCRYLKGNYCKKHSIDVKKGRGTGPWYCWKWHTGLLADEKGPINLKPSCYIQSELDAILFDPEMVPK